MTNDNFNESYVNKNHIKNPKHYSHHPSGMWKVTKTTNGKNRLFGSYLTEEKAKKAVQILKEHDWDKNYALPSDRHPRDSRYVNPNDKISLNKRDMKYVEDYVKSKRLQKKSYDGMKDCLILYCTYTGKHVKDLLKIYEKEEESLPWKKRQIKKDLTGFRNWLYEYYLPSTCSRYFGRVQTFFRWQELELVPLPKVNKRGVNDLEPMTHKDMLTKEELKEALMITNPCMKAYTAFATSSGCGRSEALGLSVRDYLVGNDIDLSTNKNNQFNSYIRKLLIKLDTTDKVPLFKIRRKKTNKYYFTFCTPQANGLIREYLLGSERKLSLDSQLFDLTFHKLQEYCQQVNDDLDLGSARNMNRFRSHMLRKYNASTLYNNGMHMEDVDSLQGRGKDSTHSAYFMEDPYKLKEKYCKYVECLTI